MAEERRQTPRIKITQLARSTQQDAKTGSRTEALGTTSDLSKGGVRFETPQQCDTPSEVLISFIVGGKIVEARGTVVHLATKEGGVASMGIKFLELSEADRKFIESYCRARGKD